MTWYELARAHTEMKWPGSAGNSRRNTAAGHTKITLAMLSDRSDDPGERMLRDTLRHWAFRPLQQRPVPEHEAAILAWIAKRSRPITDVLDLDVLRELLLTLATKDNGKPAKASTIARHRAVLTSAIRYAIERGELPYNPVERLTWRPPATTRHVDPRVVANPRQIEELLIAVTYVGIWDKQRGPRLMAFFACLYYAAMRPEEAVELRLQDCTLPESGPGLTLLSEVTTRAGSAWTDDGGKHETRGLKHRAADDTRPVPIPPVLVRILRWHIDTFGTGPDGRLFPGLHGQPLDSTRYLDTWDKARQLALPPHLYNSPVAKRPYDLRHAALTLWLNSGMDPADVARRAGNTVQILLEIYIWCIHGREEANTQLIIGALGGTGDII